MPVRLNIVKNGNVEYVRVWRSYRNENGQSRSKVVENYGRLDELLKKDADALEKIKKHVEELNQLEAQAKVQAHLDAAQEHLEQMKDQAKAGANQAPVKSLSIGAALIKQVWEELDLSHGFHYLQTKSRAKYDLNSTAFFMTAMRILSPDSKLGNFADKDKSIMRFDRIERVEHLYRSLGQLAKNKQYLVRKLNRGLEKFRSKGITLAFYDVTTYAFESRNSSELKDFGLSKDHKVNEVQVVLGLVIDKDGIPFDYELFKGCTSEFGTMCPVIKRLKEDYKIDRIIVVADRGLNSNENLSTLQKMGCDFVIAQRVRNTEASIQKDILREDNWKSFKVSADGEVTFKCKELQVTKTLYKTKKDEATGKTRQTSEVEGTIDTRWLVTYSAKRAQKDLKDIERAQEKALTAINSNASSLKSSRGWKSLVKFEQAGKNPQLNLDKINEQKKWAGYYAICTNLKDFDDDAILQMHHNLWRIEDCFRITKTSFEARPCFVWNDDSISGHFLTCYMALVIQRVIEWKLKADGESIPTNQILESLRMAAVVPLLIKKSQPGYLKLNTDHHFDRLCRVLGLGILNQFEDRAAIKTKLKIRDIRES